MKILAMATLLALAGTTAAMAQVADPWIVDDATDEQGKYFIAHAVDRTDTVELQVACDELLDGDLLISLFTAVPHRASKGLPPDIDVVFSFGGVAMEPMTATYVPVEDELVLDMAESDAPHLREVVAAIGKSKPLMVSYGDTDWVFANVDAGPAMAQITDECPA